MKIPNTSSKAENKVGDGGVGLVAAVVITAAAARPSGRDGCRRADLVVTEQRRQLHEGRSSGHGCKRRKKRLQSKWQGRGERRGDMSCGKGGRWTRKWLVVLVASPQMWHGGQGWW